MVTLKASLLASASFDSPASFRPHAGRSQPWDGENQVGHPSLAGCGLAVPEFHNRANSHILVVNRELSLHVLIDLCHGRGFDLERRQVETWRAQQLTTTAAKLTIYRAFIEGGLDIPKQLVTESSRTLFRIEKASGGFACKYPATRIRSTWRHSIEKVFWRSLSEEEGFTGRCL